MKQIRMMGAWMLLWMLFSCSAPMNEQVVKEYLTDSPALTLYEPAYSENELPECQDEFLGKYFGYCYKFFNFEVDRIVDFKVEDNQASCVVYLRPTNLTKAGEKLKDLSVNGTYNAKLKDGMKCAVVFLKEGGKWKLVVFKSLIFGRSVWLEEQSSVESFMNLIGLDGMRKK